MTTPLTTWPTALVPALRMIWLRTLFPGQSPATENPRIASLALLLFVPALLLYPCLGFRLLEPDEGRYAEIPREMVATGDWGRAAPAIRAISRQAAAHVLASGDQFQSVWSQRASARLVPRSQCMAASC